jgi:tight adherence protein C
MDMGSLFIALPIFFLFYQGVGLFLESRAQKKWSALDPQEAAHEKTSRSKAMSEFNQFSSKIGFNKTLLRYKVLKDRLELLLLRSGHPFGWKAENMLLCKELTGVFILLMLWQNGATHPLIYLVGFAVGFLLPDIYVQAKISERQTAIQRSLPGFVDLMALALESGLDFLAAAERIMEKMKSGSLRDELTTLLQTTRLGTPRKDALQQMAFRVNLPDLQALTSIVIQSEELGTSLAAVLRGYAEDMRNRRILRSEELAGKAPVKLLFPLMVFFFPIVFVIIFGPLALSFISGYK